MGNRGGKAPRNAETKFMEDRFPTTGFVRLSDLIGPGKPIPVSRSALLSWVSAGKFPRPVKLGEKISAWRVEDVRAFIEAAGGFR